MISLYQVDVGAYYWVVAKSFRHAFELAYACWGQEGCLEDVESGGVLSLERVPPEQAQRMRLYSEDGRSSQTLLQVLKDYTEQDKCEVVSCSEWP